MKIGSIETKSDVVLGPMAGFTDAAFRSLCVEQGAGLTYTEMISAKALYYKNRNTKPLLRIAENEGPVALQLFGNEPELIADEALKLEDGPYDIFDVNMGCPVAKVVGNGEGSALMLEPKKIEAIILAMTKVLKKPVSIKIRKGYNSENINAVEIARIAEGSGAAMIAVHGRTREEFYYGTSDDTIIRQVKEAVKIPVIGSGDIFCGADAKRMLDATGADAVMVARGARGNPWIFAEIRAYLAYAKEHPEADDAEIRECCGFRKPGPSQIRETVIRQLDMMMETEPEGAAVRQMRKHVGFYVTGYPNSVKIRREINTAEDRAKFIELLTLWGA